MNFSIKNLGSIATADMPIAPLTVFVGANNTNKTWAAYSLYALASLVGMGRNPFFWKTPRNPDYAATIQLPDRLEKNIQAVAERDSAFVLSNLLTNARVALTVKRAELIEGVSTIKLSLDALSLSTVLAIPVDYLIGANAELEISRSDSGFSPDGLQIQADRSSDPNFLQLNTSYTYPGVPTFVGTGNRIAQTDVEKGLRAFLANEYRKLSLAFLGNVFALPAERIAIMAMHGTLPLPTTTLVSQPVYDFSWQMNSASRSPRLPSLFHTVNFDDISTLVQGKLLEGKTQFSGQQVPRVLEYAMPTGKPFRIHAASSIVKSLAGLAIYLDGFADSNDVLIIDEPEMNAHPEAQLAIAEMLGLLVNRGIRIVITTHSPYIVDHLKNLVEAGAQPPEKQVRISSKFKLGTKEAFLKADALAVYLFQGGEVKSIFDRAEREIDWSTFGNASEYIFNLYAGILDEDEINTPAQE